MSGKGKNSLLLVVSVLFALVLAEGGLRAYFWSKGIGRTDVRDMLLRARTEGPVTITGGSGLFGLVQASEHEDIVYELKPHLTGIFKRREIAINSHGFRGPEVSVAKPPGTLRVVGIGDSHMFGWGVGQDQFYMTVLERLLNERGVGGKKWESLNFGVPGYNTVMEVATLERRALAFDPDVVVIHFVGNDFRPPHFLEDPRGITPSQWYLVELLHGLLGSPEDTDVEMSGDGEEGDEEPAAEEVADDGPRRGSRAWFEKDFGGRENYAKAMARLAEVTAERNLPVITLVLGDTSNMRQFVRRVSERNGFRVLNAAPFWWQQLDAMGFERTRNNWRIQLANGADKHPRAAGHEAYAQALAHEIAQLFPTPVSGAAAD